MIPRPAIKKPGLLDPELDNAVTDVTNGNSIEA